MAHYNSLNSLIDITLRGGDVVEFPGGYRGEVRHNFLNFTKAVNHAIFLDLEVDKYRLSSTVYGYDSRGGDWPECVPNDYAALTRMCMVLFCFLMQKDCLLFVNGQMLSLSLRDFKIK